MKMKMSEFGAPKGTYIGKFLGVKAFGQSKTGRDGKPMEPGMQWQFEITEDPDHDGALVGVKVGRITSQTPTAGNACGTLLGGLVDRKLDLNEEVDLDEFIGQTYRITIGGQKDNPDKTQVIQITRLRGGRPPASVAPSSSPPRPGGPPPRPGKPAVEKFWVDKGNDMDPELLARHEAEAWLAEVKVPPASVAACQDGASEWKTLADFGFKDSIPF